MKKLMSVFVLSFAFFLLSAKRVEKDEQEPAGKKVYDQFCLPCHQDDGGGVPNLNPPLANTSWVTGDKKKLIAWVLHGSTEKVPIDGKVYDNNMPPQDFLTDEQLADVLTYVRSNFGNKAGAVTAAEVKAVRGAKK